MLLDKHVLLKILPFFLAILLIAIAACLRIWPLHSLGSGLAWLTFYPTVMVSAIIGGIYVGLFATTLSCLTVTYLWMYVVKQPFINNSTDLLGMSFFIFTCVMISIIAESTRKANKRAKESQLKAEAANKAKGIFLANMSHELRTPLNAILGYSQLMQRDGTLSKTVKEYLGIINRSGEHLLKIINEVLETSKIEAGRIFLDPSTFNLHTFLENVKLLFTKKAELKGLRFEFIGVKSLPSFIMADETKLRIILINIIGNAIKFTEKGSVKVNFAVKEISEKTLDFLVDVADTGSGISDLEKNSLFKAFIQTESGRKCQSGTGLGLAISRDYVRMMDGEIKVVSVPEEGSTFSISMKVLRGDEKDAPVVSPLFKVIGLKAGQEMPRLLVVEDSDINRSLLVTLLRSVGLEVAEASNGREAVELFDSWHPDLIWMDIRMPVMNGMEATRIIKANTAGKKIPVIALSAHVVGEGRKEIMDSGCDDFVSKPYKESDIFEMIKRHIGVQFEYEENIKDEEKESAPFEDLILRGLTDSFIAELAVAVRSTDAIRIRELSEQIRNSNPTIFSRLLTYAKNFDYQSIEFALQRIQKGG